MTQLTIDNSTGAQLAGILEPVELVDANGRVLGTFRPAVDRVAYENVEPPLTLEELRRRSSTPEGCTTEEVHKYLERL